MDLDEHAVQLLERVGDLRLQRGVAGTGKPERLYGGHVSCAQTIDCRWFAFANGCAVRDVEQLISDAQHGRRNNDFLRRSIACKYAGDVAHSRSIGERGAAELVNGDGGT